MPEPCNAATAASRVASRDVITVTKKTTWFGWRLVFRVAVTVIEFGVVCAVTRLAQATNRSG
jgi:hypothetical protein